VQPIVESNTTFKDVKGAYLRDLEVDFPGIIILKKSFY
ncbi:hypothetical protein A2U01_0061771, partial [Trifolium medium]|nr:hypothetical protein [Trifolium medium]